MNAISSSSFNFQSGRATTFSPAQSQRGGLAQQAQRGGNFAQPQQAQQLQRGMVPQQAQQVQRGTTLNSTSNTFNPSGGARVATNNANNSSSFCPGCNTAGGRQAPVTGSFGMPTGGQAGGSFCIGCR